MNFKQNDQKGNKYNRIKKALITVINGQYGSYLPELLFSQSPRNKVSQSFPSPFLPSPFSFLPFSLTDNMSKIEKKIELFLRYYKEDFSDEELVKIKNHLKMENKNDKIQKLETSKISQK